MYQCPNCGGGLRFDIASQKLVCDHCQTQMAPYDFKESGGAEEETEFEVTKFICPQCGAEIVSSDNTAAAFCSFAVRPRFWTAGFPRKSALTVSSRSSLPRMTA